MIDLESERFLSLGDAAKLLPGRPSTATLYRWLSSGVRGVRLESIAVGGKRMVSQAALERFVQRTTAAAAYGEQMGPVVRTARQRARDIARAEKDLERAGIYPRRMEGPNHA